MNKETTTLDLQDYKKFITQNPKQVFSKVIKSITYAFNENLEVATVFAVLDFSDEGLVERYEVYYDKEDWKTVLEDCMSALQDSSKDYSDDIIDAFEISKKL